MSESAPAKELEIGSEAWEAQRQREIRELRAKEREKASHQSVGPSARSTRRTFTRPSIRKLILIIITILLWTMPVASGIVIATTPRLGPCHFSLRPDDYLCWGGDTPTVEILKGTWGILFLIALFVPFGLWAKFGD